MTKTLHAVALAAGLFLSLPHVAEASSVLMTFESLGHYDYNLTASSPYAGVTFAGFKLDGITPNDVLAQLDPDAASITARQDNHAMLVNGTVNIATAFTFTGVRFDFYDGLSSITFGDANCNAASCFLPNGGWKTPNDPGPKATPDYDGLSTYAINSVTIIGTSWIDNLEFYGVVYPTPEPASIGLVALALGGAGFASRRRSKAA